jgi:hypothetical protein
MATKQEETLNRITVTRSDDGAVSVEATAPLPLYGDETYDGIMFSGYAGSNGWCGANWSVPKHFSDGGVIGNGERSSIPPSQFCSTEDAEKFLVSLAKLALAANGVTV